MILWRNEIAQTATQVSCLVSALSGLKVNQYSIVNPDCSAASFVTFFPVEEKLSKMYRPCLMLVESRFSEGCLVLKSFPCTSAFKKPITINVLGKEQIGFFTKFGKRQQYPFHFHGVGLEGNTLLCFFCSTSFSELKP